jgi:hypothetical protein
MVLIKHALTNAFFAALSACRTPAVASVKVPVLTSQYYRGMTTKTPNSGSVVAGVKLWLMGATTAVAAALVIESETTALPAL